MELFYSYRKLKCKEPIITLGIFIMKNREYVSRRFYLYINAYEIDQQNVKCIIKSFLEIFPQIHWVYLGETY